jgi:hypothetical protein
MPDPHLNHREERAAPMQNDLTPAITTATNALTDTALALGLAGGSTPATFIAMRDRVEQLLEQAAALQELLELQTQGGGGPAADGYTAADAQAVTTATRTHTFAAIAERATVTVDGTVYLRGLGPVQALAA